MYNLSYHAKEMIQSRNLGDCIKIERDINRISAKLDRYTPRYSEVRVIVRVYKRQVKCQDGSNGDYLIGIVRNKVIVTVMLQRKNQVLKHSQKIPYLEVKCL